MHYSKKKKKVVSIVVDADPLWYYLSRKGIEPVESTNINAQFTSSIPRFLDLFDELSIKATFLIVGRDAQHKPNRKIIREIAQRGHEVASHTMTHIRPFACAGTKEKKYEIFYSKKLLSDITGGDIAGFRGTDYSVDSETLDLLEEAGYIYDCSNYSSFLAPLINLIDLIGYNFRGGSIFVPLPIHGFSPRGPYHPGKKISWLRGKRKILEIPSTAVPLFGLQYSTPIFLNLGINFLKICCRLLNMTRLPLIHTFQGIDFVDYDTDIGDDRLKVIRGMSLSLTEKKSLIRDIMDVYLKQYRPVRLKELAFMYRSR